VFGSSSIAYGFHRLDMRITSATRRKHVNANIKHEIRKIVLGSLDEAMEGNRVYGSEESFGINLKMSKHNRKHMNCFFGSEELKPQTPFLAL